jgi:hypothetical protein
MGGGAGEVRFGTSISEARSGDDRNDDRIQWYRET